MEMKGGKIIEGKIIFGEGKFLPPACSPSLRAASLET